MVSDSELWYCFITLFIAWFSFDFLITVLTGGNNDGFNNF